MTTDLSAELRAVADYYDQATAGIDVHEVLARQAGATAPVSNSLGRTVTQARRSEPTERHPRGWATISAAALVVATAAIIAVVAISGTRQAVRPGVDQPSPTTLGSTTPPPEPTNLSLPAPTPTTATNPTATVPIEDTISTAQSAGTTSGLTLDQLTTQVAIAQRTVNSFQAVVTVDDHTIHPDGTTSTQASSTSTETYLSNGSSWSTSADGSWSSYDADTGISRSATAQPDESFAYRVAENEPDNGRLRSYLQISVSAYGSTDWTKTIEDTVQLGRPAWRLTSRAPDPTGSAAVQVIDKQTGITTDLLERYEDNGTTTIKHWQFQTLDIGAALPISFPGNVPADTPVSPSHWFEAAGPLTVEQAALIYDATLYIPEPMPADARIWLLPLTSPGKTILQIRITLPNGMSAKEIWIRNTSGGLSGGGLQVLTSGALNGRVTGLSPTGIQMVDSRSTIDIRALDQTEAIDIANTLSAVESTASTQMSTTNRTLGPGQPFTVTFSGALREQRGGYLWLRTATGTNIAILRGDGNPDIPIGYSLDTNSTVLDDALSGDITTFTTPPTTPNGQYLLCTSASPDECLPIEIRPLSPG